MEGTYDSCNRLHRNTNAHQQQENCIFTGNQLSKLFAYLLVFVNVFASGAAGVWSEATEKGITRNFRFYTLAKSKVVYFGWFSVPYTEKPPSATPSGLWGIYYGFNVWAWSAVVASTVNGLLVSVILKYVNNIAKCFVAALSMICVALIESMLQQSRISLRVFLGILLTCISLGQYTSTSEGLGEGRSKVEICRPETERIESDMQKVMTSRE